MKECLITIADSQKRTIQFVKFILRFLFAGDIDDSADNA